MFIENNFIQTRQVNVSKCQMALINNFNEGFIFQIIFTFQISVFKSHFNLRSSEQSEELDYNWKNILIKEELKKETKQINNNNKKCSLTNKVYLCIEV